MALVDDIITQPQHHAYLVFGSLPEHIHEIPRDGLYVIRHDTVLGVEDVRSLHEYAHLAIEGKRRRILLDVQGVTLQAQNSLLKVLEEVQHGVHFYIFLPPGSRVLATLASRCYRTDLEEEHTISEHGSTLLRASLKERLRMIDDVWAQGESTRHGAILQMLQDLEIHTHECILKDGKNTDRVQRCQRITENLRDALYNGALNKGTLQTLIGL